MKWINSLTSGQCQTKHYGDYAHLLRTLCIAELLKAKWDNIHSSDRTRISKGAETKKFTLLLSDYKEIISSLNPKIFKTQKTNSEILFKGFVLLKQKVDSSTSMTALVSPTNALLGEMASAKICLAEKSHQEQLAASLDLVKTIFDKNWEARKGDGFSILWNEISDVLLAGYENFMNQSNECSREAFNDLNKKFMDVFRGLIRSYGSKPKYVIFSNDVFSLFQRKNQNEQYQDLVSVVLESVLNLKKSISGARTTLPEGAGDFFTSILSFKNNKSASKLQKKAEQAYQFILEGGLLPRSLESNLMTQNRESV